jgi:DeoR family transcriptional regulator, aga operon transcriptional repressor
MFFSAVERQNKIVHFVEQNERISINDVCKLFEISIATARRDLETLAEQGRIQRVHGGAIPLRKAPPELPALERENEQRDEKQRIAAATVALVSEGETIFLSGGTTTLHVARQLRDRRLTVITNSLLVSTALAGAEGITLIGLGGMFRHSEMSFIGHITEQALADLRADKVIMGIRGVDVDEGLTNAFLPEAITDRAIIRIGREVILVADHTKCERVSTAFVAPVEAAHTLVTDSATPNEFVTAVRAKGVRVIVAP